jgi:hypothetical protein
MVEVFKYAPPVGMASSTAASVVRRSKKFARQDEFLERILAAEGHKTLRAIREELGISERNYFTWREDPKFKARLESARARAAALRAGGELPRHLGVPQFDFAAERLYYFGNQSPAYQLEVVDAMQHLGPGNVLLVLLPPNHGKTTIFEDFATLSLAHDPSKRHHIGSETGSLSEKILGRVRSRLDNQGGDRRLQELIERFGPFAPQSGEAKRLSQPWRADRFDVWRKAKFDERDYSMAAVGFDSQVIGARSDHLHADDMQSRRTLGRTDAFIDKFTQDWLSRPGKQGITTIVGNRVDEGDIYEALMERLDPDILHVVRYPALVERDGVVGPLWPKTCPDPCPVHGRSTDCPGWSLEELDKEHRKHGDAVWERNWMQRPQARGLKTFDESIVDSCLNPMRRLGDITRDAAHVIGLDPAIGGRRSTNSGRNAITAWEFTSSGITLVAAREDQTLMNTQQILGAVEDIICTIRAGGGYVTDLVVEENAFQKGLVQDSQLRGMAEHYGFAVRPHVTGANKYDENVGVPSMVHSMLKQEIVLPWAADDYTRKWVKELRAQMLAWRPRTSGVALRQDLLMSSWFVWLLWRQRRGVAIQSRRGTWKTERRLPYQPTNSLVLPRGVVPPPILVGR